jgi:hypothetical protein
MDPLSYESVLNLAPTIFQDNLSTLATAFGGVKKSAVMIRELSLPRVSGLPWPKRRADERTPTAYPCSLRVCGQWLLGIAGCANPADLKDLLFPRLPTIAGYCVRVRVKLGSSGTWIIRFG